MLLTEISPENGESTLATKPYDKSHLKSETRGINGPLK